MWLMHTTTISILLIAVALGTSSAADAGRGARTLVGLRTCYANAQLAPKARLHKASVILGASLTAPKAEAILQAHEVGADQPGRDSRLPAGVKPDGTTNYTFVQLRAKYSILKGAGFTGRQIARLFDHGIVGQTAAARPYQRFDTMVLVRQLQVATRFIAGANARISGQGGWIAFESNLAEIQRAEREIAAIQRELSLRR
jgi:hypothetical protein